MKRFTKKLIFSRLISNFFVSIFVTFSLSMIFLSEFEEAEINEELIKVTVLIGGLLSIFVYIVLTIYSIFYYKTSAYELTEKEIICRRGFIFKKKSIIEYKKIHAISSKQNVIDKIFKISTLKIDSGSTNTAHLAEIQIIEKEEVITKLINRIKAIQNDQFYEESSIITENKEIEIKNIYNFNSKLKVIYSLLNSMGSFIIFFVMLAISVAIIIVLHLTSRLDLPMSIFYLILAVLAYLVISALNFGIAMLTSILKYYNFKLYRDNNNIEINYGLINITKNTFKYDRIKAIRIEQGIFKRIFGYVTVKIEVIGYTELSKDENNRQQVGVLIPLCKKSDVNKILNEFLPNYIPLEKQFGSKMFKPYYSLGTLLSIIIFLVISLISFVFINYYSSTTNAFITVLVLGLLCLLILGIMFIEWKLEYKNQGLAIDNNKITIYKGGFTKQIIVIYKKHIIGIDSETTHYRMKKGICSYRIHFKTNSFTNTIFVKCLNKIDGDRLLQLRIY